MPDALTPDEIAAIAAFPPELVQKIPLGLMAKTVTRAHPLSGNIRRHIALRAINKPKARDLWAAGFDCHEISAQLKITLHQAREYTSDLRDAGKGFWK